MLAATQVLGHMPAGRPFPRPWVAGLLVGLLLAVPAAARAADAVHSGGLLIRVPNPITDETVADIQRRIDDAFREGPLKTVLFDFNVGGGDNSTPDFSPCLKLYDVLSQLRNRVRTVAFLHGKVSRHSVLPVLACSALIMSEDATLGDVPGDPPRPLTDSEKQLYQLKAQEVTTNSPVLVLKMLNKDLEVYEFRGRPVRFVARRDIPAGQQARYREVPGLGKGVGHYTAKTASLVGLCTGQFNTLAELIREEELPDSVLREGIAAGPKTAALIPFDGTVTAARVNSMERKIDRAIHQGANLIILKLECEGGDTQAAMDFAVYLANRKDDKGQHLVDTVAFLPPGQRLGAGTAIALGCKEIIMGKGSVLCDFDSLRSDPARRQDIDMIAKSLVDLAQKQHKAPLLIRGTLEPDLVIDLVHSKKDPNYHFLVTEEEYKQDLAQQQPKWVLDKTVKHKGQYLELNAQTAKAYDLARQVTDRVEEAYPRLGVKNVLHPSSDLLDEIWAFFQSPLVRMMLVMIGIIGLILEMKMPGVGIPGVVAAVCFVLYFWSNSAIAGEFTWLAVLLFVLGLILIGLEVFVMPGVAVFGISGVVLVVVSLVLVTLDKAPTTSEDWWKLGMTLSTYTLSLLGGIVAAFLIARYLPQVPYANRLVLKPPAEYEEGSGEDRSPSPYLNLIGAIGEAATNLRPAGKARFGDEYLDVIAEGSYVLAGKRVQVIEIEGYRIVVKEV